MIPLTSAARNHQEKNARFFESKNLCTVLDEKNIKKIPEILKNTKDLKSNLETFQNREKKLKPKHLEVAKIIASEVL